MDTVPAGDRGTSGRPAPPEPHHAAACDSWRLRYEGFEPAQEGLREALCAVGNGYLVTRGAAPESSSDGVHYPGTYLAGCYNRATSTVDGQTVENEDLVNCPNWLPLTFRVEGAAEWFTATPGDQVLELDLRHGVLTRWATVTDGSGRRTRLTQRRIASQAQPHLLTLETVLLPENWSGRLEIRSALDGTVTNDGVARYRDLTGHHLTPIEQGTDGEQMWLQVATTGSPLHIALAARTVVHAADRPLAVERRSITGEGWTAQVLTVPATAGVPVTAVKTAAVYTSRDPAIEAPLRAARLLLGEAGTFEQQLADHRVRWAELWRRCRTDADFDGIGTVHLYLFHILQSFSEHSADLDVGIPARGWHGEAYRGHVFWDDLFVLQVLNLRFPELSRAVLHYRHRRLDAARLAARETGARGAMYPWQSASDGREESQRLHLNPVSGHWLPDHTDLQRHVGSAVAYNTWQYYQATGDLDFLVGIGAEMLLEIARYWADTALHDPVDDRYSIRGVLGPDEFHDAYPWSDRPGLDDNTYTNVMASWALARALDTIDVLPEYRRDELKERLAIDSGELDRWQQVSRRLRIPFHDGVLSQFDGYHRLAELDWEGYRNRYPDLRRLDRILEAEGDSVNNYKASKQADVLMLAYLFSPQELRGLLHRLGYRAGPELLRRTADYYMRRTVHGSTLSAVVHAWVLARSDRPGSWRFFRDALAGDVEDVQGGTTAEGVHLGAMAGTADLLQRCYTGLELRQDTLWLDPRLPDTVGHLDVELRYRGHWGVSVTVDRHAATVSLRPGRQAPIRIGFRGTTSILRPGESRTFPL